MSRLQDAFATLRQAKETGLVTYVTAGDPDLTRSRAIVRALSRSGADVIEIGVPFSDPIADGPAIQRATERALAAGGHLAASLDLIADVRADVAQPLVLFTYVNPVLQMGADVFAARAADAGVDGVLLLDLPIEESGAMRTLLDARGLDQVFLISPTTTDTRLRRAAELGRGFLYAISRLGVTGARAQVAGTAEPLVQRIRQVTDLPVAIGFGLSRPEHLREVGSYADAGVVGSALVEVIERNASGPDVAAAAGAFVSWLKGRA